jgi:chemotaxis protein CheD
MERIIGLGEIVISNQKQDILKTYGLGSCIGITVYSTTRRVGGMGHIVLPRPLDLQSASEKLGYYAVTGVPLLINEICMKYGCTINELEINLFGGAYSVQKNDSFQIGKRNFEEVLRILKTLNIKQVNTEVGGNTSRTIEMDISSGHVKITRQPLRF